MDYDGNNQSEGQYSVSGAKDLPEWAKEVGVVAALLTLVIVLTLILLYFPPLARLGSFGKAMFCVLSATDFALCGMVVVRGLGLVVCKEQE